MNKNSAILRNVIDPLAGRAVTVISFALVAWVVAPALATAQQVVKWTDERGQVHYSDHAPPGQATVNVDLPKAPTVTPPTNVGVAGPQPATSGGASSSPTHTEDPRAEAAREQQRKWEEAKKAAAAASAQADKDTIARCEADRETYCREGVAAIRQHEKAQAVQQYLNALDQHDALANRGIYTPAPQPPPSLSNSSSSP